MRKKLILFLMFALLGSTSFLRADELTVHDGTATNGYVPVYGFYADAYLKCEMVYPAAELADMNGGSISAVTFYATSPASEAWTATWQVFLTEVANATISDFYGPGTVVYEGTLDGTQSQMTITFDQPYTYNGGNLLVGVYCTVKGNYKSVTWGGETVEGASVQGYSYSDLASILPTQRNFLPKTTFVYTEGGSTPTPPVPTGELSITPNPFDLGERPINAWMEPYSIRILNGGPDNHIEAVISDVSGHAPFILNPEINMDIAYEEAVDAVISLNDTISDGEYAEEFTLYYNGEDRSMIQIPVTATVYTAVVPDVVEKKQYITGQLSGFNLHPTNMHANYLLQGMTEMLPDAVYYFKLTNDSQFEAHIDNGGIIAIYKWVSNFHPTSASEPIIMAEDDVETVLRAGSYYMIVASENLNTSTITGSAVDVPAPEELTYIAPENMAHEVTAPIELEWEGGNNATQYQVLFGTAYPPTQIVQDWTPIDEFYGAYPIEELNNSTEYFWRIRVKNSQGEVEGPVWGFTTTLVPPTNVRVTENQIFTDGSTVIKWDNMNTGGGFSGELTVADGTQTSSNVPVYGLWMDDYTRSEMIYPAEMLEGMVGGDITSLKYYISSSATGPWTGDVFNVYMMEVEATTMSSFYTSAGAQIVYTGGLDGQGSDMVINLTDSYHYNGGNLLVGIEEITCSTWKSCSFYGITATGASGYGYSASSVTAVPFTQANFIPKTTFTCGGRGYREMADRSFRGYNVYLTFDGTAPTPPAGGVLFTDDFESGSLDNWTLIDADGDGDGWQPATPIAYGIGTPHSGTYVASSWSWNSITLYPDQYMISPMVTGATDLQYFVATNDAYPDHYAVMVSSTGTSTSDFTTVFEETVGSKNGNVNATRSSMTKPGTREMSSWIERNITLPAGTKYVAFRHYNSDDMNYLFIDDVTISAGRSDVTATEPIKLNDEVLTENQFLFEPDETFYNMPNGAIVHVTAVYDEGESVYDNGNTALYISGYTSFYGVVTELLSGDPIANAEITFNGYDEFGTAAIYNATTNEDGEYEVEHVKVGTYTGTASADGMEVQIKSDLTNEHLTPAEVNFELHEIYFPVYKVYAEDMDNLMARVQWSLYDFTPTTGGGGSGGGGGQGGSGSSFTEGFESGMPAGWNVIDANNDGWTWTMTSAIPTTWTYYASMSLEWYRSGSNAICSGSYINGVGALNPDEYLVTPQVTLSNGSTFSFWAAATDESYPADHFGVYVSDNGTSDWTLVNEWTMTAKSGGNNGGRESRDGNGGKLGTWYNYSVDLSSFAGQKYIAIRHFNCYDQYILCVDDIELSNGSKGDRSVNYYTVYRKAILLQDPANLEASEVMLADNITDTLYADFDWYNVEPGLYQYGVSAVYPSVDGSKGERGGAIVDFETGDFSQFPQCNNTGSYPWVIVDGAHNGKGMKSSNGGVASTTSEITATVNYLTEGTVTFWALCMGEGTSTMWDKCIFEIDGVEQFCYGANQPGWNEYNYDITAGEHVFTWKYSKDSSVNPTGDYMMVDDINFYYAGGGGGDNPITDVTWSNILPKEMGATVTVKATTTTGSVEGATVQFVNQTEEESSYNFEGTFDETGEIVFEDFRKGEYTLVADLEGFISQYVNPTAISIWEDESEIVINFSEKFEAVPEMWVSNTGWARWTDILPAAGEVAERYIVNMNNVLQGETTNPYMQLDVDDLVNGQTYTAKVAVIYSTGMSAWTSANFTYQECDETEPTVDTIYNTDMDVTLVWNGGAPTPPTPPTPPTGGWTEGFESGMPAGWAAIDADGDGFNWVSASSTMGTGYGHNGSTDLMLSMSYNNNYGPLNPNNYLVTPQVTPTAGSTFSFYACAQDNLYAAEHFGVAVSTTSQTSASAFTMLQEWTLTAKDGGVPAPGRGGDLRTQGNWYQYSVDLSSYAGQNIYVAIRHFNCTDMFYIDVDDVTFTADAKSFNIVNAGVGYGYVANNFTDDGNWYYYDNGTNDDAIGLTSGGSFYWGIMFPAGTYDGNKLTKVAYFDYTAHTGTISIYQGGSTAPGELIHTQNYTATGSQAYIEFEMETPVTVDNTQNLWVVMRNNNGQYVAAIDAGPGVNYGSCLSMDGVTWYTMVNQAAASLDGNWNLRAYIETGGGGGGASAIVPNKYNILVDGVVVGATSDYYFTWTCPDYDMHIYEVVWVDANYNITCPEPIPYQIPLTEVSENGMINTTVYPNPTNGDLHINASEMVRISIVNALGQVVYDQAVKCDETVINMARFDAGIYMVNIVTTTGTGVKRVVVTK